MPSLGKPADARPNIREALAEFLAEQRERLAPRTYRNYEEVIELSILCLDGYQHLGKADRERWEEALEAGEEEAFSRLFGPEKIPEALGEFLGYFMVGKVVASEELLRAAAVYKTVHPAIDRGYL